MNRSILPISFAPRVILPVLFAFMASSIVHSSDVACFQKFPSPTGVGSLQNCDTVSGRHPHSSLKGPVFAHLLGFFTVCIHHPELRDSFNALFLVENLTRRIIR